MDLKSIKQLLEGFKKIKNPRETKKEVADIINKVIGHNLLQDKDLLIKATSIYLKVNPVLKHRILINKAYIEKELSSLGFFEIN